MTYQAPAVDPSGYPAAPQTPAPTRRGLGIGLAVLIVAVLAGGGWLAYDRLIVEDSGIAACKAMRDQKKVVEGSKVQGQLTEQQYQRLRSAFKESRHDGIRDHGTRLIDLIYQVSKLGKNPGVGALAYVGPLTDHVTGLQSACADQGVVVDLDLSSPAADGGAGTPSTAACAEVFVPGKKIDEQKVMGGCLNAAGELQLVGSFPCTDGRNLFQVDANTGAASGWGYGGGKFVKAADPAADPKYSKAYERCNS